MNIDDDAKTMDDEEEGDEIRKMKVMQIACGQMHSFVVISVKAGHTENTNDETKISDLMLTDESDLLSSSLQLSIDNAFNEDSSKKHDGSSSNGGCLSKCCCVVS